MGDYSGSRERIKFSQQLPNELGRNESKAYLERRFGIFEKS